MNAREDRLRPAWIGLTLVLLAFAAIEFVQLYRVIDDQRAIGVDLEYFRFVAQRWLDTGVFYTDRQLAGPYEVRTLVDNLYPPHALYLFVPFLALPAILWWVIPLAIIGGVVWWCRPAPWSWPLLALIVVFPKTFNQILYGNTDMWVAAFIALGVRWSWPATLVSMKPSLLFFALIGIRTRGWWVAAAVLALLSLPFIGIWLDYPTAMLHSSAKVWYSFGNLPFFVLPLVAWLASRRRGDEAILPWAARLLGHGPRTAR